VGGVSDELRAVAAACARLDVLASFAHTALTEAYTRPTIIPAAPAAAAGKLPRRRMSSVSPDGADYDLPSDGRTGAGAGELVAVEARHPVVERAMALVQRSFVPNSVMLGAHAADGLAWSDAEHGLEHSTRAPLRPRTTLAIVTGPNASGKSCFLRTAALLQILAQAGSFVVRRGYSGYSIVQLMARRGTLGTLSYSSDPIGPSRSIDPQRPTAATVCAHGRARTGKRVTVWSAVRTGLDALRRPHTLCSQPSLRA
jgi:DNA mismatch repair protein MutS